ncbi:S4 domain-containing protein [Fusarium keratoplasticum]|uniref:S4 domain-containing protein n=1 Tax=Fusarium keratoplasticum TaxID=1328300 RepID=A0ACC0QKQ7_9HYPO|nr:S4 domain-containing protein [Fusarium keratoplasticum]KAI8654896.1 S4 domain-containing protein [Fusarium keratoplasticum]KAI8655741.1 S4 domain-containing protein [Fusarium keratoplasticum]
MRKPWRFYSLNRPKLRQSWNKYNLYNIARAAGREPLVKGRATFFQQKWAAKSKTRGYHGEHIPEKKWVRLFSRRLLSSVDLPPEYLAANDGSEQAAGRGSGLTTSKVTAESYSRVSQGSTKVRSLSHPAQRKSGYGDVNEMLSQHFENMTPYMQMTFAPLERRLDTAVFRAMFASSVRQARQFIIHGAVKVNGKKMVHPSYALNPGDMFQVQVEKVLYGTGEQKKPDESVKQSRESLKNKEEKTKEWGLNKRSRILEHLAAKEGESAKPSDAQLADESLDEQRAEMQVQWCRVKNLRSTAREILKGGSDLKNLSAKQKKELRLFRDTAQRFLSLPEDSKLSARDLLNEIQSQIEKLGSVESFRKADPAPSAEETEEQKLQREEKEEKELQFKTRVLEEGMDGFKDDRERARAARILAREDLTQDEVRRLAAIMRRDAENPIDDSKPYATPWRPRPYMSAFAFIPRYLEVNPNICAAVYLRHPVARKGMAEVPTPFSYLTSQLAHNWYLGRG